MTDHIQGSEKFSLHCTEGSEATGFIAPGSIRLVYLDPPFFSGRQYNAKKESGGFEDTWPGGMESYLAFLRRISTSARTLLANDGALLIHLDWHAVHYARVMLDEVFGARCFVQEIIWSYNSGGGSKNRYGRKHDNILWYGKSPKPYFNPEAARVPYNAIIAKKREHLFNPLGKVSGDVLDIPRPPNHSAEWTGWPTQKPLALLRFLIRCHSAPGDTVADLCCGSGTTLEAALLEGRHAIGVDASEQALALARHRLAKYSA